MPYAEPVQLVTRGRTNSPLLSGVPGPVLVGASGRGRNDVERGRIYGYIMCDVL